MNFILPGYTKRFFSNALDAMGHANNWLFQNLGVQIKREVQSRGTSTSVADNAVESNFFGPHISTEKSIKIAKMS